jgi:transposase
MGKRACGILATGLNYAVVPKGAPRRALYPRISGGSRGRLDGAHHADTRIADRFRSGGSPAVLHQARQTFPFIERIYADGRYSGTKMAATIPTTGTWKLEIIKRSDLRRFVVLLKRRIVERTFAWISDCRRLAKDFERQARKTVVLGCRALRGHSSTKPSRAAMATASARLPAASFSRIPAT